MSDLFETQKTQPPALVYQGVTIHERGEMLCLTDMWRADGAREPRRPSLWMRRAGAEFIEAFKGTHNIASGNVIDIARGRNGSTWAHWQIAITYAQYLSPEFHVWCNRVIRAYMEGTIVPAESAVPLDDTQVRIAALEAKVEALTQVDYRKEIVAPVLHYLNHTLQQDYLHKRFYKIFESQFEDRAILETLVDDTTKLRQAMNLIQQTPGIKSLAGGRTEMLTINEAMARLKIRSDRPRGVSMSMSMQLATWCERNRIGVQRRAISEGGMTRSFFDPAAIDRWWTEAGQKAFGRYVKKTVKA